MTALAWLVLVVATVTAALVALYAWLRWRHRVRLPGWTEPSSCTTTDGFGVSLTRYPPRDDRGVRRRPVLLCGGLAANRFSFDLGEGASLARHLAEHGWDVWVMELRAHGRSPTPWYGWWYGWGLDEHVERDLPAAVDAVRDATGAPDVHFVGHSLGGILMYAHAARGGDRLRSGVAVGASLDYTGSSSWFHRVDQLAFLRAVLRAVPIGFFAAVTSPLAARGPSRLDEFNIHWGNIDPPLYRRLNAIGFHTVSAKVLAQLATAFRPGGLRDGRGAPYVDGLGDTTLPILAVAGTVDRQCPPAAARQTLEAVGHDDTRLAVFGEAHGHGDDYAHIDLLLGLRAREEVYPVIEQWLESHD